MPEIVIWLAAVIILLIIEAATVNLVTIWFAIGGAASLIAAIVGLGLWVQILLFVIVSAAALVFTRPILKKFVSPHHQATNADRVLGKPCVVTEQIDNDAGHGAVSCLGKIWTARSYDGCIIPIGAKVVARSIEGVKLIVTPESPAHK
jgi:membrane protein implicated in regulation of membrane protease activity